MPTTWVVNFQFLAKSHTLSAPQKAAQIRRNPHIFFKSTKKMAVQKECTAIAMFRRINRDTGSCCAFFAQINHPISFVPLPPLLNARTLSGNDLFCASLKSLHKGNTFYVPIITCNGIFSRNPIPPRRPGSHQLQHLLRPHWQEIQP